MAAAGGFAAGSYVDIESSIKQLDNLFDKFNNDITTYHSAPIDCVTDPCHMAWLIRDNRNLLSAIGFATCADGTPFGQLSANNYANC